MKLILKIKIQINPYYELFKFMKEVLKNLIIVLLNKKKLKIISKLLLKEIKIILKYYNNFFIRN